MTGLPDLDDAALAVGVGAGLVGGVFFAFSTFVMPALRSLPASQGMTAMQAINRAAISPLFLLALLGTGAGAAAVGIGSLVDLQAPGARSRVVGAGLYLAGLALTIGYHVPRNDALAVVAATDPAAGPTWQRYVEEWTRWNHARAATSVGAAVCLLLGRT